MHTPDATPNTTPNTTPTDTPAATEAFEGQCQCGALRYRVTGRSATLFACHCTECQRQSSSAFGLALWVENAQVTLSPDVPDGQMGEWVRTTPSGKQMAGRFCTRCGTRLFHQVLGQNRYLSIKPGTLDNAGTLSPVGHIWTASKQPWLPLPAGTLQYPGNPPSFDALLAAWEAARAVPSILDDPAVAPATPHSATERAADQSANRSAARAP